MSKDFGLKFKKMRIQSIAFKLVDRKLNRLEFELLPYRVFCHLFFVRGYQSLKRYQCCTRFFIDDPEFGQEIINKKFNLCLNSGLSESVRGLRLESNRISNFLILLLIIATKIMGVFFSKLVISLFSSIFLSANYFPDFFQFAN